MRHNLELSFPEKYAEDLLKIEKESFRHFVDIFMEMIKSFKFSKKEIANPEYYFWTHKRFKHIGKRRRGRKLDEPINLKYSINLMFSIFI